MKKVIFKIIVLLLVLGCKEDPSVYLQHIDGYWEIHQVKKDNKIVIEYSISSAIDYFEVNEDNSGFRKKVMPNLEGKYIVTDHESPFTLKIEDNELNIHYDVDGHTFTETIKEASESELVITNEQGFTYYYKPFEPFNLNDE